MSQLGRNLSGSRMEASSGVICQGLGWTFRKFPWYPEMKTFRWRIQSRRAHMAVFHLLVVLALRALAHLHQGPGLGRPGPAKQWSIKKKSSKKKSIEKWSIKKWSIKKTWAFDRGVGAPRSNAKVFLMDHSLMDHFLMDRFFVSHLLVPGH